VPSAEWRLVEGGAACRSRYWCVVPVCAVRLVDLVFTGENS